MNIIAWDSTTDTAVSPERAPLDLEWSYNKATKTKKQYNAPRSAAVLLAEAKVSRIARVKLEARQRISATNWEVEKYSERKQRGKPGSDTKYNAVLDGRDLIRTNSDLSEEAINLLGTPEEVNAFTW